MAATLTDVAIKSRKAIRFSIYALILIIFLRSGIRTGVVIYNRLNPPPPPEATVGFGRLPVMPFPIKELEDITYTLQTPQDKLPTFEDQLSVFFMPPPTSSILALDSAKQKARNLGFNPNGAIIIESIPNVYVFEKDNVPSRLTMNIITEVFSISYDLNSDPTVIGRIPPTPENAVSTAFLYLGRAGATHEDLRGPTTHELLKIQDLELTPAIALSEADFIKVNIFRKSIADTLPAVSPKGTEANIWFLLSGAGGEREIIAAEYNYFPIDYSRFETYPIKTAEKAWEELKAGRAYIASTGGTDLGSNVIIRRVYLAYYDAGQYQTYYQPVVVFQGGDDDKFFAYVPAVDSEYYGEEAGISQ
jgi:hypothetical protein